LARGRGKAAGLGEPDMTDILTRILLVGLGVFLIFLGVSMLVFRGIARSLRSIFAPRVIIVEKSSEQSSPPFPMTRALLLIIGLMFLLVLFHHAGPH
jgi:hypothetical protein